MKKERTKGFITGMLVMALVLGLVGTAAATVGQRTANLDYKDIKIEMNGQIVTPTDANGNAVEPFAIDGTIYLPVRAVGNALGLVVSWDGTKNTAVLTDDPIETEYGPHFAYCNFASVYKEFGDYIARLSTLSQEIYIVATYASEGTVESSKLKASCQTNADILADVSDLVRILDNRLDGVVSGGLYNTEIAAALQISKELKSCIENLKTANDNVVIMIDNPDVLSTKYQTAFSAFTSNYKAAVKSTNELTTQCGEAFNTIIVELRKMG